MTGGEKKNSYSAMNTVSKKLYGSGPLTYYKCFVSLVKKKGGNSL